jgi:hypothetical protein
VGRNFNLVISLLQLDLAPILMHVCYLIQNFHPALIHGQPVEDEDGNRKNRQCQAKICWFGATDDGLVDTHGEVQLWVTKKECEQFSVSW